MTFSTLLPRLRRTDADAVWVRAAAEVLVRNARADGLDLSKIFGIVAIGEAVRTGAAYESGYRGPATQEGSQILAALRDHLWQNQDLAPSWHGQRSEYLFKDLPVHAGLGVQAGVLQLWQYPRRRRGHANFIKNIWVPSLSKWEANGATQGIPAVRGVEVMETYAVLIEDGMGSDLAFDTALRL